MASYHVSVIYDVRKNEVFETQEEMLSHYFNSYGGVTAKLSATDYVRNNMWKIRSPIDRCNNALRILAYTPRWTQVDSKRVIKQNKKAGVTIQLDFISSDNDVHPN